MSDYECTSCRADVNESAKFCPECGEKFKGIEKQGNSSAASRLNRQIIFAVLAMLTILTVGYSYSSYQRDQKAMQTAVSEASKVLGELEELESNVNVGLTLDDLSKKATKTKKAVDTFSRGEHAKRLPELTALLVTASQKYIDSASEWFSDNKKASEEYSKAIDKWTADSTSLSNPMPKLETYKDDSEYQASWSLAGETLDKAREALKKINE